MRKVVVTLATRPPFQVATVDNSQHITLSDRCGLAPPQEWVIGQGTRAIAYAVLAYAHRHYMMPREVQYAVRPARPGEI